jgi:hypothetical protein
VSTNPQSSSQKASLVTGITVLGTAVIAEQAVARATCLDGFLRNFFEQPLHFFGATHHVQCASSLQENALTSRHKTQNFLEQVQCCIASLRHIPHKEFSYRYHIFNHFTFAILLVASVGLSRNYAFFTDEIFPMQSR